MMGQYCGYVIYNFMEWWVNIEVINVIYNVRP